MKRFKLVIESHTRNKNYQFWQLGNHAEEIYSDKFMWSKIDYLHFNPVKAGIVEKENIYSSASNYTDEKGTIAVELVQISLIAILNPNSFVKDTNHK